MVPQGGPGGLGQGDERRGANGKLTAAARAWAAGGAAADGERLAQQLRKSGAPAAAVAAAATSKAGTGDILVWEPAWKAFSLFTLSPWRTSLWDGRPLGLDWPQAESMARGLGVAWEPQTLTDLRAMETAALRVFSKKGA